MMKIDFSIIIPTYNNVALFYKAAQSILIQEEVTLELIVVDDTIDNCIAEQVEKIADNRIKYYKNCPSLGAIKNWNQGIKHALGRYLIVFHHDEALINTHHLAAVKRLLDNGYQVVVSPIQVFQRGKRHHRLLGNTLFKHICLKYPSLLFAVNTIGPTACIAIHKEIYVPFNEDLRWLVDVEWYYRLLLHHQTILLGKDFQIISSHGHQEQITLNIDKNTMLKADSAKIKNIYHQHCISLMLYINTLFLRLKQLNT